jgi:hypothetical protein
LRCNAKVPLPLIALLFFSGVLASVLASVNAQQTRLPAREAEWKNFALPTTNFTRKRDAEKTVIFRVPADWQQEGESFTFKGPHDAVLKLFAQKAPEGYPLDDYFAATLQAVRDRSAGEDSVVTRRTQFQNVEAREMVLEVVNPEGELMQCLLAHDLWTTRIRFEHASAGRARCGSGALFQGRRAVGDLFQRRRV